VRCLGHLLLCLSAPVLLAAVVTACGGDDSSAATTVATTVTTSTTVETTTVPTTVPTTTTTAPDPAQAPPCNVGEVKIDRDKKIFYEPGDPRYGTVPLPLVICLPTAAIAQSEGFAPAPPA